MSMDYDKSEPKYLPVVLSIFVSIFVILIIVYALIYYFKGSLNQQELILENEYDINLELTELKKYENDYLNGKNTSKNISINESIQIIKINYNN